MGFGRIKTKNLNRGGEVTKVNIQNEKMFEVLEEIFSSRFVGCTAKKICAQRRKDAKGDGK